MVVAEKSVAYLLVRCDHQWAAFAPTDGPMPLHIQSVLIGLWTFLHVQVEVLRVELEEIVGMDMTIIQCVHILNFRVINKNIIFLKRHRKQSELHLGNPRTINLTCNSMAG